ncbi:hypothetical protein GCM10009030_19410 [Haloarcula pellucida]|uniref:Uncharacterized protein n=1 Tax=Haloarcula pellucida TaxID=1427151 RepID=A0A830GLA3_9EURY|nr:hypothetical protein GCM10009030_19410 [Halomicroarcula pellucida]
MCRRDVADAIQQDRGDRNPSFDFGRGTFDALGRDGVEDTACVGGRTLTNARKAPDSSDAQPPANQHAGPNPASVG